MKPTLYAHPFSSYCQKALIALYEHGVPFTYRSLGPEDPAAATELFALWPMKRFPVLVDDGRTLLETSVIVEHIDLFYHGSVRLLPEDPRAALEVRMMDRVFDNYVMTPMQKLVGDKLRPEEARDAHGVAEARKTLDVIYRWLDERMAGRTWAAGETFSLADCAAAPSLFYADWAHPIDEALSHLRAYRARLLARPSVARAVDEARPYRSFFPLGAPDRD
jgi:glutathione S-transferase